jgi:hypothetical protein
LATDRRSCGLFDSDALIDRIVAFISAQTAATAARHFVTP